MSVSGHGSGHGRERCSETYSWRRWEKVPAKRLKLRRADRCIVCGAELPAGVLASWDSDTRSVTCTPCLEIGTPVPRADEPAPEIDRGVPGASLAREYERRRTKRETSTRQKHPHIGGLLLALEDAPQRETAFKQGRQGEEAVAASLEQRTADGPAILLYNRRMPGGRGDIDLLAVAPAGVFVIDAKALKGSVRINRPMFGKPQLMINGRDRTKLLDGLDRQVNAVRAALDTSGHTEIGARAVLCFTQADLPLFGTLEVRGHQLLYPKALAKRLNATGPLNPAAIDRVIAVLAAAFPRA